MRKAREQNERYPIIEASTKSNATIHYFFKQHMTFAVQEFPSFIHRRVLPRTTRTLRRIPLTFCSFWGGDSLTSRHPPFLPKSATGIPRPPPPPSAERPPDLPPNPAPALAAVGLSGLASWNHAPADTGHARGASPSAKNASRSSKRLTLGVAVQVEFESKL
jgi:hypothetical protein